VHTTKPGELVAQSLSLAAATATGSSCCRNGAIQSDVELCFWVGPLSPREMTMGGVEPTDPAGWMDYDPEPHPAVINRWK
jgi:hypothetical protein